MVAELLIHHRLNGLSEADVDAFRKISDSGQPGRVAGVRHPVTPSQAKLVMKHYDAADDRRKKWVRTQSQPQGLISDLERNAQGSGKGTVVSVPRGQRVAAKGSTRGATNDVIGSDSRQWGKMLALPKPWPPKGP